MKFKITTQHPETGEPIEEILSFEDSDEISAEEWAEDYAYTKADKGPHEVEEIK